MDKEKEVVTRAWRSLKRVPVIKETEVVTLVMSPEECWSVESALRCVLDGRTDYALTAEGKRRLTRVTAALRSTFEGG